MQLRENVIISKFQSKSGLKYLIVSSSPLRCTVVKYGVHSIIRAVPTGKNIQQNPYMHNSADTSYKYTETHQQIHVLGRYPLIINIHQRTLSFFNHLKSSPRDTLHSKALQTQELSPAEANCPLSDTVWPASKQHCSPNTRVKQIIIQCKETYLEQWKEVMKSQSRLQCYLALKRDYELAKYLSAVRDWKQIQILTRYRHSDHWLTIQTRRHKKNHGNQKKTEHVVTVRQVRLWA